MAAPSTRPTRRGFLGAASAIAGGALVPVTAAASVNTAPAIDPVIPMIEEAKRLFAEADRLGDQAEAMLAGLPADVQRDPGVLIPANLEYADGNLTESDRALIAAFVRQIRPTSKSEAGGKDRFMTFRFESQLEHYIGEHRVSQDQAQAWIAEWHADNDRIERAKEEAGYTGLREQSWALRKRAFELTEERIPQLQPRTIAGAIAMIEMADEHDQDALRDSALAGLRNIAAGGAA